MVLLLVRPDLLGYPSLTGSTGVARFESQVAFYLAIRISAESFALMANLFGNCIIFPRSVVRIGTPNQIHFKNG